MTERAELMRIYRSNGISSISLMRDHYNKYDDGGDIQPSDATFRATLTNPVNSYRSNAPAGIGDAAITKATGLLNPITAATLTAAPLGAISKINAAAKAYKAAKMANPIIASTIGASSTSAGLAGYLDSRPDKKLSRDIEDKNYVGVASDLAEGVTEGLTAISPLRVIDTKGVKKITRPLKKQLTRILRPGDIKVGDNKLSSREAAVRYLNNIDQYNVPYNSSNKEAFEIAPELEDYLIETKQSFSPEVVDKFIQRQGRMLRGVKASSPEEAITYFTNPSPIGAYGIYKAIENKKAFGGNIYDGKSTKSNQMNPSSFKVDPENTSLLKVLQTQPNQPVDPSNSLNNLDSYRYQIPTYIEVENQKVPLVRYKTDLEKEMIPKISEEYYNRIEKDNIINPEFMRMEKNIENESKEGYKNGRWYPHLSPEGGAKTIGYGDKLVPSYEYKRDRAFIKRAHAEGISDEEANNRLNYNLKVSLDAVRKDIINKYGYEAWDTMYPSLKRGLTDIRFNVGPNKEYPKATEAAIRNNIEQFMKEQKDGRSPRRVDSINTLFIDQLKNL